MEDFEVLLDGLLPHDTAGLQVVGYERDQRHVHWLDFDDVEAHPSANLNCVGTVDPVEARVSAGAKRMKAYRR